MIADWLALYLAQRNYKHNKLNYGNKSIITITSNEQISDLPHNTEYPIRYGYWRFLKRRPQLV